MKAFNLHGINDIRLEEVADPVCDEESVIVRVRAAGICGSDIPRIFETGTYHFPTIPGHEFSGEVVATGRKVGVFPLIPCMKCDCCKEKHYEMCSDYNYLGSRCDGGFAEYVKVPKWNLIELPDSVTFEQAAMLEPLSVAVHAIRQSGIKKGDSAAVLGLGTIGLFIVMFLKEMGIEDIYCIGNKEFQKEKVLELGIEKEKYNPSDISANVFFECVGKNETIIKAIESVAPSGTVQFVGNPSSDINIPKAVYWRILRKQLKVFGTWNSSFTHEETDDWHYVLNKLSSGKINPEKLITHKLAFDELEKGLSIMKDKTEDYIKVMLVK